MKLAPLLEANGGATYWVIVIISDAQDEPSARFKADFHGRHFGPHGDLSVLRSESGSHGRECETFWFQTGNLESAPRICFHNERFIGLGLGVVYDLRVGDRLACFIGDAAFQGETTIEVGDQFARPKKLQGLICGVSIGWIASSRSDGCLAKVGVVCIKNKATVVGGWYDRGVPPAVPI